MIFLLRMPKLFILPFPNQKVSTLCYQLLNWFKYNNYLLTHMNTKIKILVIGAGPAGLSTLKALNNLPQENYQIICLEKQPDWSGQWNYTWRSTTDKYGEHVHSSMYSQLWTNLPKEAFEFPDYTFQDHFGKPVPSYLPRQIYKGYFMKRFQKQGLRKYIKFNCVTRNVQWIEKESKFEVRHTELDTKKDFIQLFDFVIVATGHYSYPYLPDLKGIELFKGRVAHCHELREFNEFKDKRVLVLGGSYSAEDVTLQCYKYGAKSITWAYRRLKLKYNLQNIPKNIELKSGLSHFDESYAYFQNGQKRQIDAVLLCTGYIHHYPFLEESLRLQCKNPSILWPEGLYYSVAWEKNPKIFYSGMGSYRLSQIIVDLQGYLIRDIISGKHTLPDYLKQRRHPKDIQRENDMREGKSGQDAMNSGLRYAKELMEMTGYPRFDIENCVPIYNQSVKDREENFITYRDASVFQSIHTGQLSCKGNKTWLEMKEVQPMHFDSQQQLREFFEF